MNAPFVEHNETKCRCLFHPAYQVGRTIVETDDRTRDNIQYETVKKLLAGGRRVEAKYVLQSPIGLQSSRLWRQTATFSPH